MIFFGYFASWSIYRNNPYNFNVEDIDASSYTHIAFAFASVSDNFQVVPDSSEDLSTSIIQGLYARFNQHVRQQNPNVKTLLSIGGYGFNTNPKTYRIFSNMVTNSTSRAIFITSLIAYLREHEFDGVDLDWEVGFFFCFCFLVGDCQLCFAE